MALTTVATTTTITNYNYSRGDQFDTLIVNHNTFLIFNKPICSGQSKNISLVTDYHCVFLESMEAENDITINAVNILALGSFSAKNGATHIHAKNFYGVGIKFTNSLFVQTDEDVSIVGLHGKGEIASIKGRNSYVYDGLTELICEVATEIKRLLSQGIDDTNGTQFTQALLMAAQILNDPTGKKAITNETPQPLMLIDI